MDGIKKKNNDSIISLKCSCINLHQGHVSTGKAQDNKLFCSQWSFSEFRPRERGKHKVCGDHWYSGYANLDFKFYPYSILVLG